MRSVSALVLVLLLVLSSAAVAIGKGEPGGDAVQDLSTEGNPDPGKQGQTLFVGEEWGNPGQNGALLLNRGHDGVCDSNTAYAERNLGGTNWNNRISSADAYGSVGCNRVRHWNLDHFDGDHILCSSNCGDMGNMNNRTTSYKVFHD